MPPDAPTSVPRLLVDQALEARGDRFTTWADDARGEGLTIDEMHQSLQELTGKTFSIRTLYRWLDEIDEATV